MKFVKIFISVFILSFTLAGTALSQAGQQGAPMSIPAADSVSDAELRMVANVIDSAQVIQQEIAMQVESMVENEGMEMARFEEIMMSRQNPQAAGAVETTQEEDQVIQQIQPQLGTIQQQAQQQFLQVIQSEGMNPMRFEQVMQAVQTNAEVNQRFEEVMNGGSE